MAGTDWLRRDRDDLAEVLERAAGLAQRYLTDLDDAAVLPPQPPAPQTALGEPVGAAAALARFESGWLTTMVASAGPRFQGYVTGGATPAAVAGDWLASALDQNVASDEGGAAAMERQVTRWLGDLLGLPDDHRGAMVTGATTANFTGLAVARQWAGKKLDVQVDQVGTAALAGLRLYSGAPHSSIFKCLSMLGLGRQAIRQVPLLPAREALDPAALEELLGDEPGPVIVVANAGTVNSGDTDDLEAIVELRDRHDFWLHVDGAFGAFAALDDRVSERVRFLGRADSVAVDLHKWMNIPYDAAVAFTRHQELQTEVFHNAASYLHPPGAEPEFLHLVPENSRRFRALPVWHALVAYGRDGHAEVVRRCNDHADHLARRLAATPGVSVLAPTRLNIVCFQTPLDPGTLVDAVARSGEAFLTTTVYRGTPAVRAAFSNWRTTERDVERLADVVAAVVATDEP
jgi:glutamate/tyrosine decarboxylase-like PLP-dependent enzyme